jgi:hypothetical protein
MTGYAHVAANAPEKRFEAGFGTVPGVREVLVGREDDCGVVHPTPAQHAAEAAEAIVDPETFFIGNWQLGAQAKHGFQCSGWGNNGGKKPGSAGRWLKAYGNATQPVTTELAVIRQQPESTHESTVNIDQY